MTFSIVRPTAFFKSVSGQYESILKGNPYVLFGNGAVTQCNPIAAEDLATYLCDSALEEYKEQRWGKVSNVGGPDAPLTNKMLGEVSGPHLLKSKFHSKQSHYSIILECTTR
jgi:divinyl chlorophyllide a 8-vinyl-reductase